VKACTSLSFEEFLAILAKYRPVSPPKKLRPIRPPSRSNSITSTSPRGMSPRGGVSPRGSNPASPRSSLVQQNSTPPSPITIRQPLSKGNFGRTHRSSSRGNANSRHGSVGNEADEQIMSRRSASISAGRPRLVSPRRSSNSVGNEGEKSGDSTPSSGERDEYIIPISRKSSGRLKKPSKSPSPPPSKSPPSRPGSNLIARPLDDF
jgi:hypothetical protein